MSLLQRLLLIEGIAFVVVLAGTMLVADLLATRLRHRIEREQMAATQVLQARLDQTLAEGLGSATAQPNARHTIPVVMMSGFSTSDSEREARSRGAACFLSKPYRGSDLISAVVTALESIDPASDAGRGEPQAG